MSWTEERIEKLAKMWEGGSTASQIAEELGGVSRNAVIGKAHRLHPVLWPPRQSHARLLLSRALMPLPPSLCRESSRLDRAVSSGRAPAISRHPFRLRHPAAWSLPAPAPKFRTRPAFSI